MKMLEYSHDVIEGERLYINADFEGIRTLDGDGAGG
jgi:hypothetical protein